LGKRFGVEFLPVLTPLRKMAVHDRVEAVVMVANEKVDELVYEPRLPSSER